MTLLTVDNLTVAYGGAPIVDGLSFGLARGGSLAIVGESGAGKSQAMLALTGLTPPQARVTGSASFDGIELIGLPRAQLDRIRGARIAVVFQDPMTSLNPYRRVGGQVAEVLTRHLGVTRREADARATALFGRVRLPEPERLLARYPHELSGGMRQRVAIAMALACGPDLLILDEPTTALDTTVQKRILDLIDELRAETGVATILITHDLGIAAARCEDVIVMRDGRAVETGPASRVLVAPEHEYTADLLDALPRVEAVR